MRRASSLICWLRIEFAPDHAPASPVATGLNGGDVLTDFVMQLSRQVFSVSSSVWISFSANARRAASSAPAVVGNGAGLAPDVAGD